MDETISTFHEAVKVGWPKLSKKEAKAFLLEYYSGDLSGVDKEDAQSVAQEYLDEWGSAADYEGDTDEWCFD